MKSLALVTLVTMLAAPVDARGGLELSWSKCSGAGRDSAHTLDCRTPEGMVELFGTFQSADTVKNLIALNIVLDVEMENENETLPPFWHFETQSCNQTGVTISDALPPQGCDAVSSMWGEGGVDAFAAVTAYGPQFESYKHRGRMVCLVYRLATNPVTLLPGVRYHAFTLRFFSDNASEAGGRCAGCRSPFTIAWSAASISRVSGRPGEPDPPELLITDAAPGANCVRGNGARKPCGRWAPPKAWETDTLPARERGHEGHEH